MLRDEAASGSATFYHCAQVQGSFAPVCKTLSTSCRPESALLAEARGLGAHIPTAHPQTDKIRPCLRNALVLVDRCVDGGGGLLHARVVVGVRR